MLRHNWVLRLILLRLVYAVPLVLAVISINFLLIHAAPGDPVAILVGDYPVPDDYVEEVRRDFGLDKPVAVQFAIYLGQLFSGDLGFSYANRQPVAEVIGERLGATLVLTMTALGAATILGVLAGLLAARYRGRAADRASQSFALAGFSVPEFWLGQILIVVFAAGLGWLPAQNAGPIRGGGGVLVALSYLILPVAALSFRYLALIGRITRASLLENLRLDYVVAARARGASERRVLVRHALKNGAAPILTVVGYNFGLVMAGSVTIETVFGWPGIGRLLFESIGSRDYPVMTGILLIVSLMVVVANIVTDLVHALLDPRVGRP